MHKRVINLIVIVCTAAALLSPVTGRAQQRDIMLVLDNSGSMKKNDPDFLTAIAVKAFIRNLDGDTQLGVLIFDEKVDVAVPLSPLNPGTRNRYLESLSAITFRGQWTHSSAALERALYELRNDGRPGAEKSIVFMTDGIVDTGDPARDVERTRWIQTELADSAAASGVRVFGIAFTDHADYQLIQSLAHRSGGEYYRAYKATDIERVFQSIDTALREGASAAAPPPTPVPSTLAVPATSSEPLPTPTLPQPDLPDTSASTGAPIDLVPALPSLPQPDTSTIVEPLPSGVAPAPRASAGSTTLPDPVAPVLTLPQPVPATPGAGAGFLAELSAPDAPTKAATEPPVTSGNADSGSGAGADATATAPAPRLPPVPLPSTVPAKDASGVLGVPMPWLLAGAGGVVLALAGAGVFLFLRRRPKAKAASQVPKAFLNDIGGVTDRSSHELGEVPTVIGRLQGPEGDGHQYIVIDEGTIGRRHAVVDYTEHSYWVADQNSLNGTFVNGKRIKDRTRLKHGDRIRFHRNEFEFVLWEMFETDRTEMSSTMFSDMLDGDGAESTEMRDTPPRRDRASTTTTER